MVKRKLAQRLTTELGKFHDFAENEIEQFQKQLVKWYGENKRDLPWRKQISNPDVNQRAYAVWVSEIMLQQTQVATVISYYNKWMKKWPTLQDLAKANLEEVNEAWSGLGYYSRGRRLFEGAKKVVEEMNGEMPKTADALLKHLPGVGRYTAGAIASIAYKQRTGIVDGNVIRVLCRMRKIGGESTSQSVQDKLWELANTVVDPDQPGDFNQGMMELGATICTPKSPVCDKCPVQSVCLAYQEVEKDKQEKSKHFKKEEDTKVQSILDIESCADSCPLCFQNGDEYDKSLGVQNYPRKGKKKAPREEKTRVCVLCKKSGTEMLYCIVQRPEKGLLAGLWEFPSLQIQESEDKSHDTIIKDSCGLQIGSIVSSCHVGEIIHLFSHIHQTYIVDSVTVGDVDDKHCKRPIRWVTEEELKKAAISTAMRKVFKAFEAVKNKNVKSPSNVKKKLDKNQPSINSFFKSKS